jgi:hypothetical protein
MALKNWGIQRHRTGSQRHKHHLSGLAPRISPTYFVLDCDSPSLLFYFPGLSWNGLRLCCGLGSGHAVAVINNCARVREEGIIRFCRKRMAHFKEPISFVFLFALPKSPQSKILI